MIVEKSDQIKKVQRIIISIFVILLVFFIISFLISDNNSIAKFKAISYYKDEGYIEKANDLNVYKTVDEDNVYYYSKPKDQIKSIEDSSLLIANKTKVLGVYKYIGTDKFSSITFVPDNDLLYLNAPVHLILKYTNDKGEVCVYIEYGNKTALLETDGSIKSIKEDELISNRNEIINYLGYKNEKDMIKKIFSELI